MASETRTLMDGDIEILPRTYANAVFTSDGYTVEEKLNNFLTIDSEIDADTLGGKSASEYVNKIGNSIVETLTANTTDDLNSRIIRNIIFLTMKPENDIGQDGDVCIVIKE